MKIAWYNDRVIGIIEPKLKPRDRPSCVKDRRTITDLAAREGMQVANTRRQGSQG